MHKHFYYNHVLASLQNIDNPVMLCQDNYDNWPNSGDAPASATTTTVESSFNEYNQSEEMQFSASTEQVDTHIPSTSDSSVKVLGFKLRIDEDTMSNLHSFYQNNIGQHDFSPKMTKNRKRRVSHYEHLIGIIIEYKYHLLILIDSLSNYT